MLNTAFGSSSRLSVSKNRVLRNTYALLALSLVPTILGAAIGVHLHFGELFAGHPFMGFIAFMVIAMAFMFGIERTKDSGMGVVLLLAFTGVMGVMLSSLLEQTLRFQNGAQLIALAFGGTAVIFGGMATLATVVKRDLSVMSKFLFMGVLFVILLSVANIFLHLPALMLAISAMVIGIFSVFMLIDVQRVVNGGETNYITATLAIYLDIYNVFTSLLNILGIFGGNRN